MTREIPKCFITDEIYERITNTDFDGIYYHVKYANRDFYFKFHWNHLNSEFIKQNIHILQGLIINNKFSYDRKDNFYNNERLERIIYDSLVPKTPKAKLDNLINFLFLEQEFEGSVINIRPRNNNDLLIKELYFRNYNEFKFFMMTLLDMDFISYTYSNAPGVSAFRILKLTFKGLEYVIQMQDSGDKSKFCFIAMSFSNSSKNLRSALKLAVNNCGYDPIIVDEIHFDSDITINDAIISNIKKSKFLIADFTEQKHGVYFEAGYALGKNIPVIYTCMKDDFENTHFDTNHYPHIVYENLDDLIEKLSYKISAWID